MSYRLVVLIQRPVERLRRGPARIASHSRPNEKPPRVI
jgi:hypothetical protein